MFIHGPGFNHDRHVGLLEGHSVQREKSQLFGKVLGSGGYLNAIGESHHPRGLALGCRTVIIIAGVHLGHNK